MDKIEKIRAAYEIREKQEAFLNGMREVHDEIKQEYYLEHHESTPYLAGLERAADIAEQLIQVIEERQEEIRKEMDG